MTNEFNLTGMVVGLDSRTIDANGKRMKYKVTLRETKTFYIEPNGTKYRKKSGYATGGDKWPMWALDVSSVKPIE